MIQAWSALHLSFQANYVSDLRSQILDTAYQQFAEGGYDSVTLRSIARQLGVTHPAIYTYFESRENVFHHLKVELLRELKSKLFDGVNPHQDFRMMIQRLSENFIEFFDDKPSAFKLLFLLGGNSATAEIQLQILEYIDEILGSSANGNNLPQIFWYSLIGNSYARHTGEINKKREYELMYELAGKLAS